MLVGVSLLTAALQYPALLVLDAMYGLPPMNFPLSRPLSIVAILLLVAFYEVLSCLGPQRRRTAAVPAGARSVPRHAASRRRGRRGTPDGWRTATRLPAIAR
ncbi:hypothetical protein M0638_20875 [Roseomonas sp. NAR14]|uniref:Uncharacterized protein n=1 Tax=Roseomonas acroporae TaxID=2937791 RepID=A0A9X1YD61_9PROT|nr:hypothetical protein [Roseomonas acroporae]MCK8786830.1 hypothetical protein [Roseomonas acroporae]